MPPFVQLLSELPNIHTLEILYVTSDIPNPGSFEAHFRGRTFPSIEKVVLPAYARKILRCCPNLREVTCNRDLGEPGELVDTLIHIGLPKLEVIRGFTIGSVPLKRLSKVSPSLRCIRVDGRVFTRRNPTGDILQLSAYSVLRSLRVIEIECFENNNLDFSVKLASDVLRICAENESATKNHQPRKDTSNRKMSEDNPSKPIDEEVRLIRVLRYEYNTIYGRTASDFVPVKVEEFPVKTQLSLP
ncbi:hypothetical protein RHS04_04801 [Rhizoctonia solani]|uniref:F-box domain-containing protein n=1 Tax=Rhizoctonia solani TaxID=456999 RepID=A0A8H7HBR5_9AGAM|nr:hypothetical protein RHS04_04801 [Rhizoctonia solani]